MATKNRGKIIDLLGFAIFPVLGIFYGWLNLRNSEAIELSTPIDSYIPFLTVFIIPYIAWYAYLFLAIFFFWFMDRIVYWKTLLMIAAGEVICFIIYYFYQTTVPRPALEGDSIFTTLTALIFSNDEPVNCFPSIHVLTTSIVMLAFLQIKQTNFFQKSLIHIIGAIIIMSTLFVKQHVVYDLLGSIILTVILNVLFFKVQWSFARGSNKKRAKKLQQSGVTMKL